MIRADELYPVSWTKCQLAIFDLRIPGAAERFSRERAAWGEYANVEMMDFDHPVLKIEPGAAREVRL